MLLSKAVLLLPNSSVVSCLNKTLLAHLFAIYFDDRVLSNVDFAVDGTLVCENLGDIKTALESTAEKPGLNVNWTKTKILPVDKTPCNPLTSIEVYGQNVETVKQFTCLGLIVCSNRNIDAEISAGLTKAYAVLGRLLRTVFHKPQINRLTKARIYSASVASVVLYSSKT